MDRDPLVDARDLVGELFPQARWAVLSGSVITAARTAGSDLDIVVLLPDGDAVAPHRESRYFREWPVELFVHDEASLEHFFAKDQARRRPTLHRMVATGIAVSGDPGAWQSRSAAALAAGPTTLPDDRREYARYALTDLLDDLAHATDPGERTVIANTAWAAAAQFALDLADHWTGGGKWLLRELRELDANLADRWLTAHGKPEAITSFAVEVLDRAGGPLFAGYRVGAER